MSSGRMTSNMLLEVRSPSGPYINTKGDVKMFRNTLVLKMPVSLKLGDWKNYARVEKVEPRAAAVPPAPANVAMGCPGDVSDAAGAAMFWVANQAYVNGWRSTF